MLNSIIWTNIFSLGKNALQFSYDLQLYGRNNYNLLLNLRSANNSNPGTCCHEFNLLEKWLTTAGT